MEIMFKRFLESYTKYGDIKLNNMEYYISESEEEAMKMSFKYLKS